MNPKKHNKSKKTRIQRVDAYFKIPDVQENTKFVFSINSSGLPEIKSNGVVFPYDQISSELYYERESKPKVITRSNSPIPLYGNPSLSLKKYSHLCVVDTNTRKLHNRILSVAFLFLGEWRDAEDGIQFSFYPYLCIDFMDCDEKPERFAWQEVIRLLLNGTDYSDTDNTFGIIVDSDLGAISAINKREEPIYDQFFMPERIELVYASADKKDTVENFMIRECDQYATQRIHSYEERYKSDDDMKKFPMLYKAIRRIEE